ncbi:S1C family serine protease [Streptomyces rapamycinicus]|uniref:Protease n=3 Tax=Streptomyces rapamycinicus TaxID=1226757 RepID=A0A3L8RKV5_STRRN|nr:trypsin-like peptidase domain-containing protein [Streptomyces rapamycinicus]MBB4784223.1 putative serine protease PepD [Streptomyces rapamycinicus]RLV80294.1 protease [Streptomyces rapamycinicus NRRL 5491]UTP32508.1 trypsin-like peptidase domain-containing protein [Streptomyces rapamycinicus NRRL 5491]
MSTENEGSAVPPAPGPHPAPPAPHPNPAVPPAPDYEPTAGAAPDGPIGTPDAAGSPGAPGPAPSAPPAQPPSTPPPASPAAPAAVSASAGAGDGSGGGAPGAPGPGSDAGQSGAWWSAEGGQPHGGQGDGQGGQGVPGGPDGPGGPWGTAPVPPSSGPSERKPRGLVAAVLAAVLVAGGIGGGIGFWAADRESDSGDTSTVSAYGNPKTESRAPGSVSSIANKTLPSVVTIEAQGNNGESGTGTGFVYDKQGHILTNNHVVASAADNGKLTATFSNGKRYTAQVVGRAQGYDVAVVKLKNAAGAKLDPLPLGNSDRVAVGDATVAIGAPFGLSGTVTTGIVSAKNRPVASSDGGSGNASYMSALQTDASINPGNSGGPLLNADGGVIGINSAIQSAGNGSGLGESQQSGSIGLGFAIPINQAKNVAEQLIKTGQPVYPVIEATVNMKDSTSGATIASNGTGGSPAIVPGGPADKAGLKSGDVITKLDDTVIDSGPTLISEIWTHQPGDKVTLTYKRGGKVSKVDVTLGKRKGDS